MKRKSNSLNAIAGQIPFDSGQFVVGDCSNAYYKQQDEDIPMDKQLIQYLREEEIKRENGRSSHFRTTRNVLIPKTFTWEHTFILLSGGEKTDFTYFRLLMTKPNVLLYLNQRTIWISIH